MKKFHNLSYKDIAKALNISTVPSAKDIAKLTMQSSKLKQEIEFVIKHIIETAENGESTVKLNKALFKCTNTIKRVLDFKGYNCYSDSCYFVIEWSENLSSLIVS